MEMRERGGGLALTQGPFHFGRSSDGGSFSFEFIKGGHTSWKEHSQAFSSETDGNAKSSGGGQRK